MVPRHGLMANILEYFEMGRLASSIAQKPFRGTCLTFPSSSTRNAKTSTLLPPVLVYTKTSYLLPRFSGSGGRASNRPGYFAPYVMWRRGCAPPRSEEHTSELQS